MDISSSSIEIQNTSKEQMTPVSEKFVKLRDCQVLTDLLEKIPHKAQKGLTILNVEITCIDVSSNYLALGSNVGVIFLYNREKQSIDKLKFKPNNSITAIKLLSSVDFFVAAGTNNGVVTVFRLPSTLPGRNKELEQFVISDLHRDAVTCLEWSSNGMKLFSGDIAGVVVYTEIDVTEHVSRSEILLSESHEIVQMSYKHMVLLISTLRRALLCKMNEDNKICQIGQKERKGLGKYGVLFTRDLCKPQDLQLYSVRPGLRIWKANVNGTVLETFIFKDILLNFKPVESDLDDLRFGLLLPYDKDLLLTWVEDSLYVIEPSKSLIVDSWLNLQKICCLACCNDEIFILKGPREIIRIGQKRDPYSPSRRAIEILATVTPPPSPRKSILGKVATMPNLLPEPNSSDRKSPSPLDFLIQKIKNVTEENKEIKTRNENTVAFKNAQNLENNDAILAVMSPELKEKTLLPPVVHIPSDEIIKLEANINEPAISSENIHIDDKMNENSLPTIPFNDVPEVQSVLDRIAAISTEQFDDIVYQRKVKKKARKMKDPSKYLTDNISIHSEASSRADSPERSTKSCFVDNSLTVPIIVSSCDDSSEIIETQAESPSSLNSSENGQALENPEMLPDHKSYELKPSDDIPVEPPNDYSKCEVELVPSLGDEHQDVLFQYTFSDSENINGNELSEILDSDHTENEIMKLDIYSRSRADSRNNLKRISADHDPLISSPDDFYGHYESPSAESFSESSCPTQKTDSTSNSSEKSLHKKINTPELKYFDIWSEYNLPGILIGFAVSSHYACCCDSKEQVYYTTTTGFGVYWEKLDYCARQVSISPSGNIIWRVHRNSLFAAKEPGTKAPTASTWFEAAKDVAFAAVDDSSGWFLKITGEVLFQKDLSRKRPCFKSKKIDCPWRLRHISCCHGVVWAVSTENRLFYRLGITEDDPEGAGWAEVGSENPVDVMIVSFGPQNTGWIIDTAGHMWFRTGVSRCTPQGEDRIWWQVETRSVVMPEMSSSTLKYWAETLNPMSSLVSSQQGFILGVSTTGIWFYEAPKTTIQVAKSSLIGHRWEHIKPPGMAHSTKWNIICASAATKNEGLIWAIQPNMDAFFFSAENRRFMEVDLPPKNSFKCISGSRDGIWGLTSEGEIYIRSGMSPHCPQGVAWQILDLRQLGTVKLIHLSCGYESVWALDSTGNVYLRLGSLKAPKSQSLPPAWILVEGSPQYGNCFVQIETGPTDFLVWAIDNKKNVYVRDGVKSNLPIGTHWVHISGIQAHQLVISNDTVWAVSTMGELYERVGITITELSGQYWKRLPGHLNYLTATQDGHLWLLNKENILYGHSTYYYIQRMQDDLHKSDNRKTSEDGEWEFL